MSVYKIDMNEAIPGERGEKVLCENCREESDKVLWKMIYLALRQPNARVSKVEKEKVVMSAYYHLKEYPSHTIYIVNMKKKS